MSMRLRLKKVKGLEKRYFEAIQPDDCPHLQSCEQCRADMKMLHDLLFTALEPHMEARVAVAAALVAFDEQRNA